MTNDSGLTICFDVDDTICFNWDRKPYSECLPNKAVIQKINELHSAGHTIILFTARGYISCNGDTLLAEQKNRPTLEQWLKKHKVQYDGLIFGKPRADLYVDDRSVDVQQFLRGEIAPLQGGGSNKPIYRLCSSVKKDLGDDKNNFLDWLEDNKKYCNYPAISSFCYNSVYMDYIDGKRLCDCATLDDIKTLTNTIFSFSQTPYKIFDFSQHAQIINQNKSDDAKWNSIVDLCINKITEHISFLQKHASFSHGDTILSNVIKTGDNKLYFIDARYNRKCSTYLFDLAKTRMSLDGYELKFGLAKKNNAEFLQWYDGELERKGLYDIVVYLHLMYIVRLYRYKDLAGKEIAKQMAEELLQKNEYLF